MGDFWSISQCEWCPQRQVVAEATFVLHATIGAERLVALVTGIGSKEERGLVDACIGRTYV